MVDNGRRQSPRIKAKLKIRFKDTSSFISEYTHNISKRGVFIRTKKPCKLGDQVQVVIVIPETEEEISALGVVIRIVTPDEATSALPAGMGIQIDKIDRKDQDKIEEFINLNLVHPDHGSAEERRNNKRYETRVRVLFGSKQALVEEYIRNISHGGIFIQHDKPMPEGEILMIVLVHPNSGKKMALKGEVVRVITPKDVEANPHLKSGMGIRLLEMDDDVKEQLDEFIKCL